MSRIPRARASKDGKNIYVKNLTRSKKDNKIFLGIEHAPIISGGMVRTKNILNQLDQLTNLKMNIFSNFPPTYSPKGVIKRFLYLYEAFNANTIYFPYSTQEAAHILKMVSRVRTDTFFLIDYHEDIIAQRKSLGKPLTTGFINRQKALDELFFQNDQTILIFTTEDFKSAYNAPKNSVIIHNGADPIFFRYTPLPSEKNILYVGGITKNRGLEILIKAVKIARKVDKRIKLLVYGHGLDKEYVNTIAQLIYKIKGNYMGKIAHHEVPKVIENSLICASPLIRVPYFDLGEPIKLFEYMACGRPVVGSNIKQQQKIIEEEKCGIVYNDRSPNELAESILALIEDPQLAKNYGQNGRKAIEKRWSWKVNVMRAIPKLKSLGAL